MYENRIKHLQDAHAALNKRIDGMESTGEFEDRQLNEMKSQRLHLKQEIDLLERMNNSHNEVATKEAKRLIGS